MLREEKVGGMKCDTSSLFFFDTYWKLRCKLQRKLPRVAWPVEVDRVRTKLESP